MKQRIYIAGCGGMLGEAFYHIFKDDYELKCTDIDVNDNWLSHLDFRDYVDYEKDVINFQPDYLFHLGAYTDLEYCELNIGDTYITNTISVKHAVNIANKLNILLLYISTAGIFDGKKEIYSDCDMPNPSGHYAISKYMGELFVQRHALQFLICRAGWMMGGGYKKDKKFIQKLMRQIKSDKKVLHVVNDKLGTPTYTYDFALNVKLLLENNIFGIFNMACDGKTSRLEITKYILSVLKLEDKISIVPVSSDFFNKEYFAPRSRCECLSNDNLKAINMNVMRDWKTTLKEYLNKEYVNNL